MGSRVKDWLRLAEGKIKIWLVRRGMGPTLASASSVKGCGHVARQGPSEGSKGFADGVEIGVIA